jgi:lipoprotein-anchoring transpeptidase ErfK/SrfK
MNDAVVRIDLAGQRLRFSHGAEPGREYPVSTAANGPGEAHGSFRTPRGEHVIRARIGAGAPPNTVFVGRRPTGESYHPAMRRAQPDRDWILTRILWLSGTEPGFNRLGGVDTMRRYIYIHGTPDDVPMGIPGSHGCVRMRNHDIIELFDLVAVGTRVLIQE